MGLFFGSAVPSAQQSKNSGAFGVSDEELKALEVEAGLVCRGYVTT